MKYSKTTCKQRYLLTSCNGKSKGPLSAAKQLQKQEKCSIDISSPKLVSTTALTNDWQEPRLETPIPGKKNLAAHYSVQADKAENWSVTPENVQQR